MSNTSLGVLGGCLCFVVNVQNAKDMYYGVWLIKEYGVESSWTKVYKIEKGAMPEVFWSIKPLIFSRNGKKVLFQGIHFGRVKFIWYDVEKKRGKSVKIQNLPAMFASSVTSIGSLLLLDDDNDVIGPRQNKRTRSKRRW
nr:f-box protein cpr30 [Quercus suber]